MTRLTRALGSTAAIATLVIATAAPVGASTAPTAAEPAPVEWVVSSQDTLADAIDTATATQSPAAVADALRAMADRAEDGGTVDFPGLDTAPPTTVVTLADSAADALAAGKALPAHVERFEVAPNDGFITTTASSKLPNRSGGATTLGYVSGQGYSYTQDNWVRRGLSTTSGTVNWTDKFTMVWVTTPAFTSSRHTVTTRYFPTTGFFTNPYVDIDAFRGNTNYIGTLASVNRPLLNNGTQTKYVSYSSVYGKNIFHVATLAATMRTGGIQRDGQRTETATCYSGSACKYS